MILLFFVKPVCIAKADAERHAVIHSVCILVKYSYTLQELAGSLPRIITDVWKKM